MNVHLPPPRREPPVDYPRFKLPASLSLQGVDVLVRDWSPNTVSFAGSSGRFEPGERVSAILGFAIGGAQFATEIAGTVASYDTREGAGELTYRLAADDAANLPGFVVGEYLAGRIIVMDGMLTKSDTLRAAPVLERPAPGLTLGNILRRAFGLAMITVLGGAALYYLGSSIYDRLFVFEAASAQVSFDTAEIDAPVAGTLAAVAPPGDVVSGASLFRVVDAAGASTQVPSPCACTVAAGARPLGSYVSAGSNIIKLIKGDAAPEVTVSVAFPDIRRVYDGAAIDLKFLDGQWIRGAKIKAIRSLDGQQNGLVVVEVDPGRALTVSQYGEPVYARFDTAPWRRS